MHLFGQRGIPASLRNINGYSVHTYTLNTAVSARPQKLSAITNREKDGRYVYVKWHIKPDAGNRTMDAAIAERLAGSEPDYHVKDLFEAIKRKDFPTWSVFLQVITPEQAKVAPIDIFDDTYTWPHEEYPLRLVGRLTLNRNVS